MTEQELRRLLAEVRRGALSIERAVATLRQLPFEDLGFAKVDHHRPLRQGFPEVVYARGKTAAQVAGIVASMLARRSTHNILVTRADRQIYRRVRARAPRARFFPLSGTILIQRNQQIYGRGSILVVSAGTSDIPVAEEAAITALAMGNRVETVYDVGVAGLHRLLEHRRQLTTARVIICVAGMEGALPSVVAGLVGVPVIAVPTSTGYGASLGGLAALLTMLNSCAANVAVVNIDNGFGAGCLASVINRL